jgi:hypothetical protein
MVVVLFNSRKIGGEEFRLNIGLIVSEIVSRKLVQAKN